MNEIHFVTALFVTNILTSLVLPSCIALKVQAYKYVTPPVQ